MLSAQGQGAKTASLAGTIVGASGTPVAVHLQTVPDNPMRYYDGYEADLHADGSFSFTFLPPGEYRLWVEAPGFTVSLPATLSDGSLTLRSGEERRGVAIQLSHTLSICGHVTSDIAPFDAWGRQVEHKIVPVDYFVTYYRFDPEFGVLEDPKEFGTNKDGSFGITDLAPGTYYLRALSTWYGDSNSFSSAKPIVVGPSSSASCNVDIHVLAYNFCWVGDKRQQWQSTVVGKIDSGPDLDTTPYRIEFIDHNTKASFSVFTSQPQMRLQEATSAGQSFKASLCAGTYDIVLYKDQQAGSNLWADKPTPKVIFDTKTVTVGEQQTVSVELTPHSKASLDGTLQLDQTTREAFCPGCQSLSVSILREGDGEFQTVTLDKQNRFAFSAVTPGRYQLFLTASRPEGAFLQSILVNDILSSPGRSFTVSEAKRTAMIVTLSGDVSKALGHVSPDVRRSQRWEAEGLRPRATVAGRVQGEGNTIYTVRLLPVRYNSNAPAAPMVTTAADGTFRFDDVFPGVYRLEAYGPNYLRFDYGAVATEERGTPLLVAPGAQLEGLVLPAPQLHSVCGHITDSNGAPQFTLRIWFQAVHHGGQQLPKEAVVDEHGSFRVNDLRPDDYFLQYPAPAGIRYVSADGSLNEAEPLHVDGKDVGCGANPPLELHIPAYGNKSFAVSGAVNDKLPARLGDRFLVELQDRYDADVHVYSQEQKLGEDGSFHFEKVASGRYTLKVFGLYGPEPKPDDGSLILDASPPYYEPLRHLVASQPITVTDHDISGLSLQVMTLPSVAGTVRILQPPPGWKDFKPSNLSVEFLPHRKNGVLSAGLTQAGEFMMGAADPGEYEVRVSSSAPGRYVRMYVQSARLNGQEVNPRFLTLGATPSATLDLTIGSQTATVNVHVAADTSFPRAPQPLNEDCRLSGPRYGAVLVALPLLSADVDHEPVQSPQFFFSNQFTCRPPFTGKVDYIPPGNYLAVAAEDISSLLSGGPFEPVELRADQRKFWAALMKLGKPVTLQAGESVELELHDSTLDAARIAAHAGLEDGYESLRPPQTASCQCQ